MGKIKTIITFLKNKDICGISTSIANNLEYSKLMHIVPDKLYLKLLYRLHFGKPINFSDPKTFNEKLQWLKINNRNQKYSIMVDKYRVRDYIAENIGKEYLSEIYGIWNHFDDIDFSKLPNQFVLKCNHDSGSVIICKNKSSFDKENAKVKLERALKNNMFFFGREWPYKYVEPCIIAEEYLVDDSSDGLSDYKFFCFNGKVKCFKIDFDRFINHHANYYDVDGVQLPFGEKVCLPDYDRKLRMPVNLNKMINLAEKLSSNQPFLRVDFYEVNRKIVFGELTFYPASGFGPFVPQEWDEKLGGWLNLPNRG